MICLTLPVPPSANLYWRSRVVKVNGKPMPMVYVSAEATAYKADVAAYCYSVGIRQPLAGRVWVHFDLYPQRPQDWARRQRKDPANWDDSLRRIDLDNARKVLNDALAGVVFGDDALIFRDSGEVMEPDEHGARVEVTIRSIVRRTPQQALIPEAVPAAIPTQASDTPAF